MQIQTLQSLPNSSHYAHLPYRSNATHILAAAKQIQNEKVRNAFGIGDFYVEGSAMDPDRKEKEALAKKIATKKYKFSIFTCF